MAACLALLLVGSEDVLADFEEDVKACNKAVGVPIKTFTSWRAHEAVSKLQACIQTNGSCSAVFLSERFTAKGKEEYSDVVRKVLREKHPNVPVVCWGNPHKGGEQGKDYHYPLDWKAGDRTGLAKVLLMLKNGEIDATYKAKGKKSVDSKKEDKTRKSLDASSSLVRRKSIEGMPAAPAPATPAASALRRMSMEMLAPGQNPRTSLDAARSGNSMTALSSGLLQGQGMGMMGMVMMASPRGSVDMPPHNGGFGPYGMMPSSRGTMDTTHMNGAMEGMSMMLQKPAMGYSPMSPMGMGMGTMSTMQGPISLQPPAAPAVKTSNAAMIQVLAEEVTRLKGLVEQKRAREAAVALASATASLTPGPNGPAVTVPPALRS